MASPLLGLVNAQLASSAAALYSSPASTWTQLLKLVCTNTDSVSRTVTFHIVPTGGSATTANKTTIARAVAAGATWNSANEYGLVLNPGDALWGFASTAAVVNVFVSGLVSA